MKNIVILISGRGSNMRAIVEKGVPGAGVTLVVSNEKDAPGLAWAKERGLETAVVDHRGRADRTEFEMELTERIEEAEPDLVVLAGFMRVLGETFCRRYEGRLLNIHPSLLPSFTGLDTHARALKAGVRIHGCTAHFVIPELDMGPPVIQAAVPVSPDDDADSLAERVLAQEHIILPKACELVLSGAVRLRDGKVERAADLKAPVEGSSALVSY